jgi:hypothetical protein
MAFKKIGSLDTHGAPVLRRGIITNSLATTILDSVKLTSGFVAAATAGTLVFGHIVAHKVSRGTGLTTTGVAGAEFGSYVNTYTAASNNQTVSQVVAEVDISKTTLYSAELSAAIGTTTGSNLAGYFMDVTDKDTLNEASAVATTAQYFNWGVDPDNTAQAVVNIYESQVFGV